MVEPSEERVRQEVGGHAALARNCGYQRRNTPSSSLVSVIPTARLTVDGVAGFRRLVPGSPSAGREFGDSIDRKIGQAREHRAEVVADR